MRSSLLRDVLASFRFVLSFGDPILSFHSEHSFWALILSVRFELPF